MDISGAQIDVVAAGALSLVVVVVVVVVIICMVMIVIRIMIRKRAAVAMAMRVVVLVAQQPGARDIDAQAKRRDRNGLAKMNGDRAGQPHDRFVCDAERDHSQNDGARKRGEFAKLAGAHRKALVVSVAAGQEISQARNGQRRDMGAHMPAVGNQRDRAEQRAARDLGDHHKGSERDDAPGPALMRGVIRAEKGVIMRPLIDGVRMRRVWR